MNKWRSPTAEKIYQSKPILNVRSAGTSSKARQHVSAKSIRWADVIMVMEKSHRQKLTKEYPEEMKEADVYILGIEDNYLFMDPELIEELAGAIEPILEEYLAN